VPPAFTCHIVRFFVNATMYPHPAQQFKKIKEMYAFLLLFNLSFSIYVTISWSKGVGIKDPLVQKTDT
jgi:hypothetical protein